jgi:hypothetical protein
MPPLYKKHFSLAAELCCMWFCWAGLFFWPSLLYAEPERFHLALQSISLAPNAGGQTVYGFKVNRGHWELSLFSNQSIYAGNSPYSGALVHRRFAICGDTCFWQLFIQLGGGASNGGPVTELTWGSVIPLLPIWLPLRAPSYIPAIRLDVTTQIVFIRWRAVTWTYPVWVGLSIPL